METFWLIIHIFNGPLRIELQNEIWFAKITHTHDCLFAFRKMFQSELFLSPGEICVKRCFLLTKSKLFFPLVPEDIFWVIKSSKLSFFLTFFFLICNDRTMKFQLFCVTVWRFDPNMKSWITSSLFSWNLWLDPQSRSICSATPLVEKVCTFAVIQLVLKNVHHLSSFFLLIPNFPGGPNRPPRWIVSPCAGMSFHCCASVIVVVFLRLERLCCL